MATPTPVFPAAVATDQQLKVANNVIQTTLKVSAGVGDTILFVNATAGFVANGLVSIDNEIIAISSAVSSPNAQLIVAAGGRGFDGTTAAPHSAGAKISMLIDAWHHNALATEIKAVETFLGPNGQNLASLAGYQAASYNFAPQSPGGSLIVGSNVITLAPVPSGVNGSDANHYLYISGGTGTAEAVLITGGTAVAGAASGTVIVNCANAHSGAWTIATATGGIQEAIIATGGTGTVAVSSLAVVHAPISVPSFSGAAIFIEGLGREHTVINRASDYPNGNLFNLANTATALTFRDLNINANPSNTVVSGAAIYVLNSNNSTVQNGAVTLDGVIIGGGQYGVRAVCSTIEVYRSLFFMYDSAYKSAAGISIEGPSVSGVQQPASNVVIANSGIYSGVSTANAVSAGLNINGLDGGVFSNITLQGDHALLIQTSANNYTDLLYFDQLFIDQARTDCVRVQSPDATGLIDRISIHNSHIGGSLTGAGMDIGSSLPANITTFRIVNNDIEVCDTYGIIAKPNANLTIIGNHIVSCNIGNYSGVAGIYIQNVSGAGHLIQNNIVGNDPSIAAGHIKYGLQTTMALNAAITGNDFSAVEQNQIVLGGPLTGILRNNVGIDNMSTAGVPAAATLALPGTFNFVMSGTATVTAVTTNFPAGTTGTFIGSGAAFTAGASIGNSGTAATGKPYRWYWDGTQFWISGSGF